MRRGLRRGAVDQFADPQRLGEMASSRGQRRRLGLHVQEAQLHMGRHLLGQILALDPELHEPVEIFAGLLAFAEPPIGDRDIEQILLALDLLASAVVELLRVEEIHQRQRVLAQQGLHRTTPGQAVCDQPVVFLTPGNLDARVVVRQGVPGGGERLLVGPAAEMEVDLGIGVADPTGIQQPLFGIRLAGRGIVMDAQDAVHVAITQLAPRIASRDLALELFQVAQGIGMGRDHHLAAFELVGIAVERPGTCAGASVLGRRNDRDEQRHRQDVSEPSPV